MRRNTAENFWAKVDIREPDECWNWLAGKDKEGYGKFRWGGETRRTHRLALELCGNHPGDKFALHTCDNPSCCNPAHLYVGTPQNNTDDMMRRGRHRTRAVELDVLQLEIDRAAGMSFRAIGAKHGVSYVTVMRRLAD